MTINGQDRRVIIKSMMKDTVAKYKYNHYHYSIRKVI